MPKTTPCHVNAFLLDADWCVQSNCRFALLSPPLHQVHPRVGERPRRRTDQPSAGWVQSAWRRRCSAPATLLSCHVRRSVRSSATHSVSKTAPLKRGEGLAGTTGEPSNLNRPWLARMARTGPPNYPRHQRDSFHGRSEEVDGADASGCSPCMVQGVKHRRFWHTVTL